MRFTKGIETFWVRDISKTQDISIYYFKYFQGYILIKLYQNLKKQKSLNYSQKFQYSVKNSFFLILWHAKVPPSITMTPFWH